MVTPIHEWRQPDEDTRAAQLARQMSPLFQDADDDYDSDDDTSFEVDLVRSDAQKHWDESVRQLDQALFFVLCPVIGRILGRRFARSLWTRFVDWRWLVAQRRAIISTDKAAS